MDKGLLETFWVLAEGNDDKRINAVSELVAIIKSKQAEGQTPCIELTYTVDRLIKGLASSRKWARLGFSTALTQVLRQFPDIEASTVIVKTGQHLKVTPCLSKSEKSNLLLGRIMAYLALMQSDRLLKTENDEIKGMIQDVLQIKEEKAPLHQISTEVLVQFISKINEETFNNYIWPLLEGQLTCGWNKCTPDTLWLLIVARKHHHKLLDSDFMSTHWGSKNIFSKKNYEELAGVIKKSTADHPIIHPVCTALVHSATKKPNHFVSLWSHVLYDKVFPSGLNYVYLVFQLIPEALSLATTTDQVYAVLPPKIIELLVKNLMNKQCALHSASKQLNQALIKTCSQLSPNLQVAVIISLVTYFHKGYFSEGIVTKMTQAMIATFSIDAAKELANILMDNIKGNMFKRPDNSEDQLKLDDLVTQQKWSVLSLSNLISQDTVSRDLPWCTSVAKFLFCMSFFGLEYTKAGPVKLKVPLSTDVREKLSSAFFRTLDRLSKCLGKHLKGYHAYTDCLYNIVQCAQSLLNHEDIVTEKILDEKALDSWQGMISVTDKIKQKLDKMTVGINDQLAFQLLFLHHGLQLFTEPTSAIDVLSELQICYKKATAKKRRQSVIKPSDEDEPEWIDVITDLLLSLLSQKSHLVRTVVSTVLTMICPHMTRHSLKLVLEVFQPKTDENDEDLLQFEDDDDDEVEEIQESEDSSDETNLSESEESETEVIDENFVNSVKSALGRGAAGTSDEESEEELDDNAMCKLDDALAKAFKAMSKNKKQDADKIAALQHFKMRCLDVLEVTVNHCSSCALLLDLIIPLLSLMDAGVRNTADKELGDRAHKVFSQLMAVKKLPPDPNLDKSQLVEMVQKLIEYSAKVSGVPMIQNTAAACAFVIKIITALEKYSGPSPIKTRAMASSRKDKNNKKDVETLHKVLCTVEKALIDFCERRDSEVNHYFFLTLLEKECKVFWPLAETLFEQIFNGDVRIFCRTQCAAMLSTLISKSSIKELEPRVWDEFAGRIVTKVFEFVQNDAKQVQKPRYLHELLILIHKVFIVLDKSKLKDLVTKDMLDTINKLKGSVNSDSRHIINKICGYCSSKINPDNGKKQERKVEVGEENMLAADIQNGTSEDVELNDVEMECEDTKELSSQNTKTPNKVDGLENRLREKKEKSAKKRRKSEIQTATEVDSELMKEKKKKRKSLGINL